MFVVFDFVFRERDNEGESFVHNLDGGWEQGGLIPCDDAASSWESGCSTFSGYLSTH